MKFSICADRHLVRVDMKFRNTIFRELFANFVNMRRDLLYDGNVALRQLDGQVRSFSEKARRPIPVAE
jgi:hypothetical protein